MEPKDICEGKHHIRHQGTSLTSPVRSEIAPFRLLFYNILIYLMIQCIIFQHNFIILWLQYDNTVTVAMLQMQVPQSR